MSREEPLPATHFRVTLGDGEDEGFAFVQIPPLAAEPRKDQAPPPVVVLRRPATAGSASLRWWQAERDAPGKHIRAVTIVLLDVEGRPALRWTIHGARPLSLAHGALDAEGGGLLSETIELAFDAIDVSGG